MFRLGEHVGDDLEVDLLGVDDEGRRDDVALEGEGEQVLGSSELPFEGL